MKPALLSIACLALAGCGYIGPPLPPALNIPTPILDLSALELGDKLIVQGTLPKLTTDGLPIIDPHPVDLYIGPSVANVGGAFPFDAWSQTATRMDVKVAAPGPFEQAISVGAWAGKEVVIAARAVGPTGRKAGWSKLILLRVGAPLDPPSGVAAANAPNGVAIQWTSKAPRHRILRSLAGAEFVPLSETDSPNYTDESIVLGMEYRYIVVGLAGPLQQSLPSAPAPITPADVFPPAVPTSLGAVPGAQAIELTWARNTEDDLRGYNIFRSVDGAALQKLASLVETPVYSDTAVSAGHRYRYTVSAVDMTGNESDQSMPIEVAMQ